MRNSIFCLMLFLCANCLLKAQNYHPGIVIGICDNHVVEVKVETGALVVMNSIANLPSDAIVSNLEYVDSNQRFYALINARNQPELIIVDLDGSWQRVATLTYQGEPLFFAEGMAYDRVEDVLYLTASLNGAIVDDKKSEALLRIDRLTGECQLAATLTPNVVPDDFDEIVMFERRLFGLDGVPGARNTTYIYPFNTSQFDGRRLFPGTKQNIPYFTMNDVVVVGHLLYFPHFFDGGWYYFDLRGRRWAKQAELSAPAFINTPIKLTGLTYFPLGQA